LVKLRNPNVSPNIIFREPLELDRTDLFTLSIPAFWHHQLRLSMCGLPFFDHARYFMQAAWRRQQHPSSRAFCQ